MTDNLLVRSPDSKLPSSSGFHERPKQINELSTFLKFYKCVYLHRVSNHRILNKHLLGFKVQKMKFLWAASTQLFISFKKSLFFKRC